jgi:putative CocE/NonD family hydrolase
MSMSRKMFAGAAVMIAAASTLAVGQGANVPFSPHWDDGLSQPAYKVRVEHDVRIAMGDGVTLSADIYRPDTDGHFPALIERTPYSNNAQDEIADSKWFAERGYVVVNEDVRGRYDSDGKFYPYRNEANDGFDTDEWVAQRPWSNGKIGTLGGSYLGYTQLTQGLRANKHLISMSAEVTSSDIYDGWAYVDGAFVLGFALPWGAGVIDGHVNQSGTGVDDWPTIFQHLPVLTAAEAGGYYNQPYRDWLQHPRRDDPYWTGISFERQAQNISVPLLVADGWYDIFLRGALRDDANIRQNGATALARDNKHMIIGPWVHFKNHAPRINGASQVTTGPDREIDFGPDAQIDMRKVYLRWQDHWLKGTDNGVERDPPISLFVMGENRWRFEHEWPLARTRYTKYYLQSAGHANGSAGGGTLDARQAGDAPTDTFVYDPASPVPTLGGTSCCSAVPNGPHNQARIETRDDVLIYTTPVLTEALEVTGPLTMKLYAATSAADTDWTAKLVDVWPDGYAQNLQDGILRARYRRGKAQPASLPEPGKVTEYDIDMWATSNLFLSGHRIRLEISSSNFPHFDRNLNTGEDPATGTRMQKATQTIYHSTKYPSYILLAVIPSAKIASK